jgi:hypothetical protein
MATPDWLKTSIAIVRSNLRAYIVLNVLYYGLVAAAMIVVAGNPELQAALTQAVVASFTAGPLSTVFDAYAGGNVLLAIVLTFAVNFFLGSVFVLFVPSLLIPFGGVAIGLIRATLWGLLLAPTTPELQVAMIPHSVTLVLEGQGYILAMLGAFVLGKAFVSPSSVGASRWRDGYFTGLKQGGRIYVLVALVLAIAAVYEALEVIYLVPRILP